MARNVTTIYDSIIEYKKSREELDGLNSTSQVAIYKLWAYIMSVAIFTHELLWDLFRIEINGVLDSRINGTKEWYVGKAYEYQDGDELIVLENKTSLGYDPVIEGNRLITRCAHSEDVVNFKGRLNLKTAKGDVDNLEELTSEELGRVVNYFEKIKFAGTNINIISVQADEVVLQDITIYHDGVRTNDSVRADVEAAMNDFLVNLPFDGVFYVESFRDSLQLVDNVVDVYIAELRRISHISGSPVETTIVRKVEFDSGHAKISSFTPLKVEIES